MVPVGIDLGTTNSLIAVLEDGVPRLIKNNTGSVLTPSVVSLIDGVVDVGAAAHARLITHPENAVAVFKRAMGTERAFSLGGRTMRAEELSALVLSALKADAEADLGHPIERVVVSVPAYFNEVQRKAVKTACRLAGLTAERLINEPTAAALAYGLHERDTETTFLVYDLGGGTFDVSVMEFFEGVMEVKATAGDAYVGGEDFTSALSKVLAEMLPERALTGADRATLHRLAEAAKRKLSSAHSTEIDATVGEDRLTAAITRSLFESATTEAQKRLRRPVDRALYDAGLSPDDLDNVVLVGGATRMPVIRSLIAKQLRKLPVSHLDPDHVVALGAAVQAGLVAREAALEDMVMTDVTAFTLGVDVVREINGKLEAGFFHPIIERNTVVPVSREEQFSTAEIGQTDIMFQVFQGEAPFVTSNVKLGEVRITVPPNRREHEAVTIRFTYDVSGLLEVDCLAQSTGRTASTVIRSLAGEMSDREVETRLTALKALKVHPRELADTKLLLARLEEAYAMARAEDRMIIAELLARYKNEIERQDLAAIEKLATEIAKRLDGFEAGYVR
ncbi:MAG: Hsp70 family protein [Pseudomonadota bacterium]